MEQQEDENISLLLTMGFPDVRAIKRALKLSNGDVNEAVTFLTEQPLTSYSTVDDLRDVEMDDPALRPPSYDQVSRFGVLFQSCIPEGVILELTVGNSLSRVPGRCR